jgi:large subunit ribosomal protein L24
MKIKVGDEVEIICGNNSGCKGNVIRVLRKKECVVVSEIAMQTHCIKKCQEHPEGAMTKIARPIHWSNVRKVTSV